MSRKVCWCGERGYPTAHSWYLCEWGHEFYCEPPPPPRQSYLVAASPKHYPALPYGNFIETGVSKPPPFLIYNAA